MLGNLACLMRFKRVLVEAQTTISNLLVLPFGVLIWRSYLFACLTLLLVLLVDVNYSRTWHCYSSSCLVLLFVFLFDVVTHLFTQCYYLFSNSTLLFILVYFPIHYVAHIPRYLFYMKTFQKWSCVTKGFLQNNGLLIVKNHLLLQFVENVWF